jgi:hypothetical protein
MIRHTQGSLRLRQALPPEEWSSPWVAYTVSNFHDRGQNDKLVPEFVGRTLGSEQCPFHLNWLELREELIQPSGFFVTP